MDLIEFLFGAKKEEPKPKSKGKIKIDADKKQEPKNSKTHTEELRPKREDEENAD